MSNKIGIGIITCNRPEYLRRLLASLVQCESVIDELVVVNDGKPINDFDLSQGEWIDNKVNLGVGKSKNLALRHLLEKKCDSIFLLEDDIVIKDKEVFNKYIEASSISGIQHFNFAFHGNDNYLPNGAPAERLRVEYSKNIAVCFYPNVYGAFSFYTKECLERVGLMDEEYYNAVEHIDHTYEVYLKGMTSPFRWFADIAGSEQYIEELDRNHEQSTIRKDQRWILNFHKAADRFKQKYNIDIRNPYEKQATKQEVIIWVKKIKKRYK
jgi:GT2 family glycosyltransferase